VRKTAAFVATLGILATLTACSGEPGNGCSGALPSGDASSVVTATGKFGSEPEVEIPTPLHSKKSEASVLIDGGGDRVGSGQPLVVDVTIINGTDASVIQKTRYSEGGGTLLTAGDKNFPALGAGLLCATVGSRVAIVGSPEDSHGAQADLANGVKDDDAFVYVVDIKQAFPERADGADRLPQNGLPALSLAADGTPGLTFSSATAPKKVTTELTKAGDGAKVAEDSLLVVKYSTFAWGENPTLTDSNWSTGSASVWQIGSESVAPELGAELVGKRAGSQVIVVIPDENGSTGAATVHVVDILGVVQ
jgi:peptidylprolyl isomerase